ncbi:MAG TPA: hypothetical protein GX706_00355 [Candidatus Moranbacteria bacterium]|nr:hypothetical protein [Candidatus Moranbacteria bacterium]
MKKESVTNQQIVLYIDKLTRSLGGVRKDIPPKLMDKLRKLFDEKRIIECVDIVKNYLNIKNQVMVDFQNSLHSESDFCGNKIIAQINAPPALPFWGLVGFYQIKLILRLDWREILNGSCDDFLFIVSHEFCHFILQAIRSPLQESEIATDLTAMILGFSQPALASSKNLSLLNKEQMIFAQKIILEKAKLL